MARRRGLYSYAAAKKKQNRTIKMVLWLFSFFLCLSLVTNLFFKTIEVRNDAMDPSLEAGDRLIVFLLPYGPLGRFFSKGDGSLGRSDLVLVARDYKKQSFFIQAIDEILRFFTFQRL